MKKRRLKFMVISGIVSLCTMFTVALADPGTEGDPLISKSYIDNVLMPKIEKLIENKIDDIEISDNSDSSEETVAVTKFKVVEVNTGEKVICNAGTEMILRAGKATIIATEKGGVADVTIGTDLKSGEAMPANHMLIVPVADGRGFVAKSDVIVMIKGGYSIK